MNPHSHNLLEAARLVRVALDDLERTEDIGGLTAAINQVCDRISELNDATGQIMGYLELMILAAKTELDLGGAS